MLGEEGTEGSGDSVFQWQWRFVARDNDRTTSSLTFHECLLRKPPFPGRNPLIYDGGFR